MICYKKKLYSSFWVFLLGIPTALFFCFKCFSELELAILTSVYCGLVWVSQWIGNSTLSEYLDTQIDWKELPLRRFITGIIACFVWAVISLLIINLIFFYSFDFNNQFFSWQGFLGFSASTALISIFITGFFNARAFLIHWKEAEVNTEKLKGEIAQSRLNNLKNQVNPHFLFNSFNTLSSLIYQDQELAVKYTKGLSKVYRYILESEHKKWISLKDELDFCQSFIYLHKIRFEENLNFIYEVNSSNGFVVIPCSVQMLLENAIKHNEISDENPMRIECILKHDSLVVRNTYKPKLISESGTGKGLSNIQNQYHILSGKEIEIRNNESEFEVSIPLMEANEVLNN